MKMIQFLACLGCVGCSSQARIEARVERTVPAASATAVVGNSLASVESLHVEPPIEVKPLDPTEHPVTFALRGRGRQPIVFLAGLCGHAQGYVQSFQEAAAERGTVIAPQGENLCGAGPFSTLSGDIKKLDQRIARGFAALAIPEPTDVVVIGYSLGATRAEALARLYPERYTRLVLIGAPASPSPWGLKGVKRAVMLAGSRDRQDLMRQGVTLMKQANIPSTFLELPGAYHGQMGNNPDGVMAEALRFVLE